MNILNLIQETLNDRPRVKIWEDRFVIKSYQIKIEMRTRARYYQTEGTFRIDGDFTIKYVDQERNTYEMAGISAWPMGELSLTEYSEAYAMVLQYANDRRKLAEELYDQYMATSHP